MFFFSCIDRESSFARYKTNASSILYGDEPAVSPNNLVDLSTIVLSWLGFVFVRLRNEPAHSLCLLKRETTYGSHWPLREIAFGWNGSTLTGN